MEETKRCPFCDELIRINAVKCRFCGSMLTEIPLMTAGLDSLSMIRLALASRYEILHEVGKGGMATVYRAIQKNLGRPVALKVIHLNLVHDSELVQRFHREARISSQLIHKNIISIYDEGTENNIHFMSMEFLEGTDLYKKIKEQGTISPDELVNIIVPIAEALDYAHKKGVVHRDVKSANIFLADTKRPVLMDFGIAHASTGTIMTQTIIGTPEFMSPEQADGKELDHRSDIYSLGVVAYQALTGRLPYCAENPLVTISKILSENYTPIRKLKPKVPEWMEGIIDACLVKDKVNRIQSCAELARLLQEKKGFKKIRQARFTALHSDQRTIKLELPKQHNAFQKKIKINAVPKKNKIIRAHIIKGKKNLAKVLITGTSILIGLIIFLLLYNSNWMAHAIEGEANQPKKETITYHIPERPINDNRVNNDISQTPQQNEFKDEMTAEKKGESYVEMPDITGLNKTLAEKILRRYGLNTGGVLTRTSTVENSGLVIRQGLPAGTKVKKGARINLIIGE